MTSPLPVTPQSVRTPVPVIGAAGTATAISGKTVAKSPGTRCVRTHPWISLD